MDRRDFAGILFAALPALGLIFAERVIGQPMDALIASGWAPFVVAVVAFGVWVLYVFAARPLLGPTRADLQRAVDKMIDYRYLTDGANTQLKPAPGLSEEQVLFQHAPEGIRAEWYRRLGLGKPKRIEPYR